MRSPAWHHWLFAHPANSHRAHFLQPHGLTLVAIAVILLHILIGFLLRHGPLNQILGYSSEISADRVLASVNAKRAEQGLETLRLNGKLNAAAASKAQDMLAAQYWSHTSPTGKSPWSFVKDSGYSYAVAGENLAKNFGDTSSMVDAWLASSTHRENLLSNRYTETGIAVVNGVLQGTETTLVVQMFASPKRVIAKASPAPQPSSLPVPVTAQVEAVVPIEVPEPQPEVAPPIIDSPILGDETARAGGWQLTPMMLYRFGLSSVAAFLIALLFHDALAKKPKKQVAFGKNLAHIVLLLAVVTTILAAEGGRLL